MSSTKTQESKLPQWQEDFIREQILPRGIEIADTEYTPYTGETIAGMTPTPAAGAFRLRRAQHGRRGI